MSPGEVLTQQLSEGAGAATTWPQPGALGLGQELRTLHVKRITIIAVSAVALVIAVLLSVAYGSASVGVPEAATAIWRRVTGAAAPDRRSMLVDSIIVDLRLPRTLLGLYVGIALAIAGAGMQAVLRNPLVSPFTLGVSSAASFGAAMSIVFGVTVGGLGARYGQIGLAFVFGMSTVALIYAVSTVKGGGRETYLLTGIAVGYLFSAGVSTAKLVSQDDQLRDLVLWTMGGMWGASWESVIALTPIIIVTVAWLYLKSGDLNAMTAGEDVATSLGVRVRRLRITVLILATAMASATIAFTGIIGFVGLVAPHVARMLLGGDARYLLPGAGVLGALLIVASDTVGRVVLAPVEVPVGIITSFIGVPFFIFLIVRQRRGWWG